MSTQMQSQKTSAINCTGIPTKIRGCFLVPRTQLRETCALEEWGRVATAFVSYIGMLGFLSEILGVELNAHYG